MPEQAVQLALPETMGGQMGQAAGREAVSGHITPWHWVPK